MNQPIAGINPDGGGASAACWCLCGLSTAGAGRGSHVTLVLIIEDEESISGALSSMLRKEGFAGAASRPARMRWRRSTATGLTWCCSTSCSRGQLAPKCAGACANDRMCR